MANRIYHHAYDAEFNSVGCKKNIRDFVFQDTYLAPYKAFVNSKVRNITEKEMVWMLVQT